MTATTLVTSDGEPATLHDLGGDGPPLLLTHGNGLNAGMWATVVPHLRPHFRCHGLDFRGHGGSRPTRDGFSVERSRFVDEVLAAVDAVGGPPVVAAGHSLGGATLLRAEVARPGTFVGLWLFEPVVVPVGFPRPEGGPAMLIEMSRRRRMAFDSVEEAFSRFRSKPPYSDCEEAAVRAYVELGTYPLPDGGVRLSCSGDTEARIFESGGEVDFATLAAVTCPVAVALGANVAVGNDLPPRVAPLVAEALPDGHLERFEHLTHFGPMEDGSLVAAAIEAHLRPLARC
jgi:pimeloyl-ACP methyl ester carboxylesterase